MIVLAIWAEKIFRLLNNNDFKDLCGPASIFGPILKFFLNRNDEKLGHSLVSSSATWAEQVHV